MNLRGPAILGGALGTLLWAGALVFAQPGGGSFWARMDQNGNGMLDPNEVSDRMRGVLERLAQSDRSINLSQPIPLDRLSQAMERSRGSRGGRSEGGRDERDRGGRDRGSDSGRSSGGGSSNLQLPPPLVPGFATPDLPPVLGFGEDATLAVTITEADRREASERMNRYDRNKDGFLDPGEMAGGRWSGQPFEYDRNRDGKLSLDELALRYAERRIAEEKERAGQNTASSGGSSRSSNSRGGSSSNDSSGSGIDPRMEGIVNSMMSRYDKNRNGMLDRDEWGEMRSDPSAGDKNRDGRITKEEMAAWLAERSPGGGGFGGGERGRGGWGGGGPGGGPGGWGGGAPGGWGGPPGGGPPGDGGSERGGGFYAMRGGWGGERGRGDDDGDRRGGSPRSGASSRSDERRESSGSATTETRTYRFRSALERVTSEYKNLPDWFARSDVDGDGQLLMSEYATEWPESKINEFLALDRNGDGVVTAAECIAAIQNGFKPGAVASSRPAAAPTSPVTASSTASSGATASAASSVATASPASAPTYTEAQGPTTSSSSTVDARYLGFAQRMIERYDTDKNGSLSAEEAKQVSVVKPDTDADGDGQITVEELARALMNR